MGSTQVNFAPKSLNADLSGDEHNSRVGSREHAPKETARLGSDEVHTIVTRPVVDLKLLADGNTAKHNDLQDITEYRGLKGISRQTHLEALNEVDRDRLAGVPSQVAHGYIGVEL